MSTVTATRILKGQMNGKLGPETPLAMDKFPFVALAKVRAGWPQSAPHHRGGVGLGSLVGGKAPGGLGSELGAQGLVMIWVSAQRGAEGVSVPRHTTWTDKCQTVQAQPQPTCVVSRPTS